MLLMLSPKPHGSASFSPLRRATLVYCDNISVVYISSNLVQHQRSKHVEIDLHSFWERAALSDLHVLHIPTTSKFVDVFTKGLYSSMFTEFPSSLNVQSIVDSIAGAC